MVEVPIFIVNGLLDSGKTSLIKEIIENNVSYQTGNTLLVICEEGEVEYEDDWRNEFNVHIAYVSSQEELTKEFLISLDEQYTPGQIVLEMNSFFDLEQIEFPEYMPLYQQITLLDASKFALYFTNMKQIINNLVKYSSLVVFNRCDGVTELATFRRQIRALNKDCQIGFEGKNGQLTSRGRGLSDLVY